MTRARLWEAMKHVHQTAYRWTVLWVVAVAFLAGFAWKQGHDVDTRFREFKHGICAAVVAGQKNSASQKTLLEKGAARSFRKAKLERQLGKAANSPVILKIAALDELAGEVNAGLAANIHVPKKGDPVFPGC